MTKSEDPKSESREPPASEPRLAAGLRCALSCVGFWNSVFGLLSGFVIRPSSFLFVLATGCSLFHPIKQTQSIFRSVEGTVGLSKETTNALLTIQSEVMREADTYVAVVAQASDDFAAKVGAPDAKAAALQWKLQQATAAYTDATGENPVLNAVDMVVLASLSRKVIEDYWVGEKYGEPARPLLLAHRQLEDNAWLFLNQFLPRPQQVDLRKVIDDWSRQNPNQHYVAAVRLREFMNVLGKQATLDQASKPNGLLNMLSVDPLSGLDPAVRAIEQTRLTAQRIMYYTERMPSLLGWQVELTTYRLAEQPASQQVLSNANSLSRSAQIFAQTAQELPGLVNTQREAAINQLFAGIAVERSNILANLESQESKLRELLPEVRQTLAAGSTMANSLNGAIDSLDAFVRYVSPPDTNPPVAVSTNSHPFNVLDYGKTATEVGAMARDLQLLINSVNQSATQLAQLSHQTTASAEALVDRAFRRGLALLLVLLAGSVVAGLAYRALARKLAQKRSDSPAPKL